MRTISPDAPIALLLTILVFLSVSCRSTGRSAGGGLKDFHVGPGPEDFEFDRDAEGGPRLIVSSAKRGLKTGAGRILSVPVLPEGLGGATPFEMEPPQPDFHPIGISLVPQDGKPSLYVIVEGKKGKPNSVQKFRVQGDRLVREGEPLTHPLLKTPNDLVALPDGHVYVSNVTTRGFLGLGGHLFRKASGNVIHYDGKGWREAASGIAFGNGLAASNEGDRLYVAGFVDRAIHVYQRDPATGALTPLERIDLKCTSPDNLMWKDGDPGSRVLTVATHLSSWKTTLNLIVSEKINAPSAVYQIDTAADRPVPVPIFEDDGSQVSASSTALLVGDRLFISQLRRSQIWETAPQTITAPSCEPDR